MNDRLLIFGGGDNQRTLIATAREKGLYAVVIDPNPQAPGRDIATAFEVVPARDFEATLAVCRAHRIDGIVTCQMENPLLLMARVAAEMGYTFPRPASIARARDKWSMKQAFMAHAVPCARGLLFEAGRPVDQALCGQLQPPLIIKPTDAFSSRGVFRVESVNELATYEEAARAFSSSGACIVEEFLEGPEVSVESVTSRGVTTIVQITDKVITPFPATVEMAHIQPTMLDAATRARIVEVVKDAVRALDLDSCATHAELKITAQGPRMIEIGARLGGDYITSHLTPLSSGVNIEAAAIDIALNREPDFTARRTGGAVIRYLDRGQGVVVDIADWSGVLAMPGVRHAGVTVQSGAALPAITDSAKRHGFVICDGSDRAGAIRNADAALAALGNAIVLDRQSTDATK